MILNLNKDRERTIIKLLWWMKMTLYFFNGTSWTQYSGDALGNYDFSPKNKYPYLPRHHAINVYCLSKLNFVPLLDQPHIINVIWYYGTYTCKTIICTRKLQKCGGTYFSFNKVLSRTKGIYFPIIVDTSLTI